MPQSTISTSLTFPQTLTDAELSRYARQILLDGWDIEAQQNLKNSHVLIIGMGGLGCPVAETLVRAGVGQLTILDNDNIDDSNLQRQTLFTPADIGKSKVFTAQSRLQAINELVKIEAIEGRFNLALGEKLLANLTKNSRRLGRAGDTQQFDRVKFNIMLDCTDNFATRDGINQFSVIQKIPLLTASAIGFEGQLALFEPAKNTGCYHCLFQQDDNVEDERNCVNSGVLASTPIIMGNLQANAALQFLGLQKNPLAQTLLLWQGQSMTLRKLKYQADPNCIICGKN